MIPRLGPIVAIVAGLALGGAALAPAAPPNDDCATPTVIATIPFVDTLNVSSATGALLDPILFCPEAFFGPAQRTVWYSLTAPGEDVFLQISTAGSTYDTILAVHRDTCASPTTLACSDDYPNLANASQDFVAVRAGETVLIEVAADGAGGTLQLAVGYAPVGHPVKAEPEFVVNTYTPGVQGFYGYRRGIDVCGDGTGRFVVAWEDWALDGSDDGIFARRFDDGGPLGGQFQVNAATLGAQVYPSVACGDAGEFVVAWNDASAGAEARRFDGTGAPVTGDVAVSASADHAPTAAMAASGEFTVVFEQSGYVKARRFDATGAALGPEFQVSTGTGVYSHASGNAAGEVIAVWYGGQVGYEQVVKGRRIESDGTLGAENTLVTDNNIDYSWPRASMNASGEFIVAWGDNFYERTSARRFDTADNPIEAPIRVAGTHSSLAREPLLADDGSFVVAWDNDYSGFTLNARRFEATGAPIGDGEFQVPTFDTYPQYGAEVAPLSGHDFVVVWSGFDGYGDGCGYGFCGNEGVRARRFTLATAPPSGCPAAPAAGCRNPTVPLKAKLQIVDDPDPVYDLMRWNWVKGEATTVADLDDPTAGESYSLCLYDASNTLIYGSLVPAGGTCGTKPCWKAVGDPPASRGYKYKSKERAPHGITKLTLKPGAAGSAKIVAKGGRENLFAGPSGAPPLPLALPATMQLRNTSGECWQAVYSSGGVVENTSALFKGTGS
jgi:hypothetical protein